MESVVLDTIKDIALILRAFDPGGCTDNAPLDEYCGEAVKVYLALRDLENIKPREAAIELFTREIYDLFSFQFSQTIIPDWEHEMWKQMAWACSNAWRANVGLRVKRYK